MTHLQRLALLSSFVAIPAFAQSEPPPVEKTPVQYERRTEIDFGERSVFSTIRRPLGWYEFAAGPAHRWTPLVRLRADFDAEIVRSADVVR